MFGFGFAMVPFYNVFCDLTGLNGRTAAGPVSADVAYSVDEKRTVTVEFIANINETLPWDFKPEVVRMQVRPGQAYTTRFYARNRTHDAMIGHAVPSVAPGVAAQHFKKTECFCFTEQRFAGGEGRWMPVRFVIDPELPGEIGEVALSYTFFDTGKVATAETGLEPIKAVGRAKQ
ncbi:MAG: cytochrome c oxidase assembly protein [Gammaproteobacteria bacterium]|nr:cytochrome c oxidase assembly protein [Gammaproteobacteria bacterium]